MTAGKSYIALLNDETFGCILYEKLRRSYALWINYKRRLSKCHILDAPKMEDALNESIIVIGAYLEKQIEKEEIRAEIIERRKERELLKSVTKYSNSAYFKEQKRIKEKERRKLSQEKVHVWIHSVEKNSDYQQFKEEYGDIIGAYAKEGKLEREVIPMYLRNSYTRDGISLDAVRGEGFRLTEHLTNIDLLDPLERLLLKEKVGGLYNEKFYDEWEEGELMPVQDNKFPLVLER